MRAQQHGDYGERQPRTDQCAPQPETAERKLSPKPPVAGLEAHYAALPDPDRRGDNRAARDTGDVGRAQVSHIREPYRSGCDQDDREQHDGFPRSSSPCSWRPITKATPAATAAMIKTSFMTSSSR